MDLFERRWQTYRSVVDHDWMEHRGLAGACDGALTAWLVAHPERQGRAHLLDLGCGDLAQMSAVFAGLPLGSYCGVDITAEVLPAARAALGPVPFTAEFHRTDVMSFVDAEGPAFDLVHAALVLHHLSDTEKADFLTALRRRIHPDGLFVWADVFRDPGESVPEYAARYATRIRGDWTALDHEAREALVTHMSTCDFPAERDEVVDMARRCGWHWRWVWQGTHRAEAVAVLTPANS